MTRPAPRKGRRETSLEDAFHAGRYTEVIARTVDAPTFSNGGEGAAFVVGALAFVGRIEEAKAALAAWERCDAPAGGRIAARFFLGVAHCRAGRYAESLSAFRESRALLPQGRDALARFYVHQGLACYRYFTGDVARAARHALRALGCAFEGRFQYGRLLATDLRAHALVQLGEVRAGLALLEQARSLGTSLGLAGNVAAIACAVTIYRARFGVAPIDEAMAALESLRDGAKPEDSYSSRAVELELACQYALSGAGDRAWSILERMAAARLPDGDHRARVRLLVACAFVARLRYGATGASPYAAEARRALDGAPDVGLEVEVLSVELLCDGAVPARLARLEELHARTRIARAASALARFRSSNGDIRVDIQDEISEDRPTSLLLAASQGSAVARERLLRDGYLGLYPLALAQEPGRRLHLVGHATLLVEELGNVRVQRDTPDGALRLLRALGDGAWHEKESLVRTLWNLSTYRPDRHDPLVHTAVSRLRAALGTAGHWIEGRAGAYRLAPAVELVDGERPERSVATSGTVSTVPPPMEAPTADAANLDEVVRALVKLGPASTSEIARALGASEMTAFRRLRALVDAGTVTRAGRGRSTRYALRTAARAEETMSC